MNEPLRQQATAGMRWSAGAQGARQIVQLATLAALTRLLEPDDFGLMAMSMVFVGFAQLFHDLGTGAAIIQRATAGRRLIASLFWINCATGIVACLATVASAGLIAGFFEEPRLVGLLQFIALTFLVSGPGVVPKALLRRHLKFNHLARIDVAAIVVGAIAAVIAAWLGAGAFALAIQALTFAGVTTILLWIAARFRPTMQFAPRELRSVASFSLNLTAFNICNHITRQADYLIIGKLAGAEALGLYSIAYQVLLFPLRHVSGIINRVMYPVYARLQHDRQRLRRAFCRSSANVATIAFPILAGMAVAAVPIVHVLFGERWHQSAVLLSILVPVGCIQALVTTFGSLYHIADRNGLLLIWSALVGLVVIIALVIGAQWGAVGVAAAYSIATMLVFYPCMAVPFALIGLPIRRFLRELWRPAACSALMAGVVLIVRIGAHAHLNDVALLVLLVAVGAGTYAALTWMFNRQRLHELLEVTMPRARVGLG